MLRKALLVPVAATGIILLSASSCQTRNDAPTVGGDEIGDRSPAQIIAMPDGFSNVASKCDPYRNRIYTMYHGGDASGSIFVVPQDPTCAK